MDTVMAFIVIVRAIMAMTIKVDTELSFFLTAAPSVTEVRRGDTFLLGEGRDQRNA